MLGKLQLQNQNTVKCIDEINVHFGIRYKHFWIRCIKIRYFSLTDERVLPLFKHTRANKSTLQCRFLLPHFSLRHIVWVCEREDIPIKMWRPPSQFISPPFLPPSHCPFISPLPVYLHPTHPPSRPPVSDVGIIWQCELSLTCNCLGIFTINN